MRQKNDPTALIIFIIIMLLIMFFSIRLTIKARKKAAEKAEFEARRKSEEEKARKAAIAAQQEKERKREEKRLDLQFARDEYRSDFKLFCIGTSSPWSDEYLESLDNSRVDRAYYQKDKIKLVAYDKRYHVGKIRGTSFNYYLTSSSFCTCEDFHQRLTPCKHMYFLAHELSAKEDDTFIEVDYEKGLSGLTGFVFGRFPDGKDNAIKNLQERGLIVNEVQSKVTRLAVAGKTTAVKKIEQLTKSGIPIFSYADALQIFTSEIRHPEALEEAQ